ncbi:MAG: CPBP family intramembrane glutamic endopeptidase [Gemmatimonadaceae bacterium]
MSPVDLVAALVLGIGLPAYGYFVGWPAFQRRLAEHPHTARLREYRITLFLQWLLGVAVLVIVVNSGRPLADLRLVWPTGVWAALAGLITVALATLFYRQVQSIRRSDAVRERIRAQTQDLAAVLPHTREELRWFYALSLTAGVCEELLYRGYLPAVLAPWLTWWGAALLALVAFGLGHAYQGRAGVLKTTVAGAFFVGVVALTGSLVPAMALHALVDIGSGASVGAAYFLDRET